MGRRAYRLLLTACPEPVEGFTNGATFLAPSTFLAILEITDLISYLRITGNPVNIYCTLHLTLTHFVSLFLKAT
jgi:hypothetical protein